MLRHLDVGVAEHLGDILQTDAVGQADRGRIRVPGTMRGQILADHADVGNLLQIAVHLLVAWNGQQYALLPAGGVVGILAQNLLRNIQQRDVAHVFGLLTGFADPEISVVVADDVLRGELLHVDEGQPREGGKDEDVADQRQPLQRKLLAVDGLQLVHRQKLPDDLLLMEANPKEGVLRHPVIGAGQIGNLFQTLHVADDGILLTSLLRLQIEGKGTDQLSVDLREGQILLPVTLADQLSQITPATLVATDRNQRIVRADQRPALVVVLLHGPQQRADLFRLLLPEEELLQQVRRDGAVLLLQFAKDLIQLDAGLLDIGVQVAGAAALAAGRLLGLAPQGRVDALADVVLDARPVDGDAHADGGLSVFQQLGLLEEEKHAKRISFHGSYLLFDWFDKCRKSDPI